MNEEFGKFIENKRKERQITLRGFADLVGICPAFMSDLEKARRYPPDKTKLEAMAHFLNLTAAEKELMYDLAAKVNEKYSVPPDLPEYLMNEKIPNVRVALRLARDTNADNETWRKVIEILEERYRRENNEN